MLKLENASPYLTAKKVVAPKKVTSPEGWTLPILQEHLQWAVDVELFTIPFYMSAMYSIKDQSTEAGRLIKSVVNQEMLHMQSAANVANAYGTPLHISAPLYGGEVPHLNFKMDEPDPTLIYHPHSTAIGAFDLERLNTMCIIEFPDWNAKPELAPEDEYGSIGELYESIKTGCTVLADQIQGGNKQVDLFSQFYPNTKLTVTESGKAGLPQVINLIDLIVDQGEGLAKKTQYVPKRYQNPADDIQPTWDHYEKFTYLLNQPFPETYSLLPYGERQIKLQKIQLGHFDEFLKVMNEMFTTGDTPESFGVVMYKNGAAIAACWQNGVLPAFSH